MRASSFLLRRSILAAPRSRVGNARPFMLAAAGSSCAVPGAAVSAPFRKSFFCVPLCVACRGAATTTPYGSVPSDIDGSRNEGKPREEQVFENERRRRAAAGGTDKTAEEARDEQVSQPHVSGYNPWEVLGLKAGASSQTIRLRYHELMKEVHPDMAADGVGDIPRLNQINKAYELITKSPTLDKRYRNLVSDTQYFYYKFLPEWMARNVDEMPRYWSWAKWRTPGAFQIFLLLFGCYAVGRFFAAFPKLTTVFVISVGVDILFHTMIAPATLSMLFLYSIMAYRSYDMAWLTSPKGFLRRELGY